MSISPKLESFTIPSLNIDVTGKKHAPATNESTVTILFTKRVTTSRKHLQAASYYLIAAFIIIICYQFPRGIIMSQSLYEKIGGDAAVNAAVDIFYRKVLADDRINQFFDGVDMERQATKQKAFLTVAFGGPNNYSGKDMRDGHAHLVARGLNDSHFDAVMENLAATLKELNVPDDLIAEAAAIAESTRNDVLGR
jgi:hemoglobin